MTVTPLTSSAVQTAKSPSAHGTKEPTNTVFLNILEDTNQNAEIKVASSSSNQMQRPPTIKELMDRTGLTFADASELIYGVVGSNTDKRDWVTIMASTDVVGEIKMATAKMYRETPVDRSAETNVEIINDRDTLEKTDCFAIRLKKDASGRVLDSGLKLIDKNGLVLRDAGVNSDTIKKNADLFGYKTSELAPLSNAAGSLSKALQNSIDRILYKG